MDDSCPSLSPCHTVNTDAKRRAMALAIRREILGLNPGNPLWIVIRADKDTGEITCGLRAGLPDDFMPQ